MNLPRPDGTLLAQNDGATSRHRQVLVRRSADRLEWNEVGPELTFAEMSKGRRAPITVAEVEEQLTGAGFVAANLGVSAAVTVYFRGMKFALVAFQGKRDVGDRAHQLVSGYRESGESIDAATMRELGEEILLHDGSAYVPLRVNSGEELQRYDALNYRPDRVTLERGPMPAFALAVDQRHEPALYYPAISHSAQAVVAFDLHLPDVKRWTLSHCEDAMNPVTRLLESRISLDGLRLVRLDDQGQPVPEVFALQQGRLESVEGIVTISEVFCQARGGVLGTGARLLG